MDSVSLATQSFRSIEVGDSSEATNLDKAMYPFSFKTESGLLFSAEIAIQGIYEKLKVIVDKNGQIKIDKTN